MKHLFDTISKELKDHLKSHFPRYIIRVCLNERDISYILVTIPRGNISNNDKDFLFQNIQLISIEKISIESIL